MNPLSNRASMSYNGERTAPEAQAAWDSYMRGIAKSLDKLEKMETPKHAFAASSDPRKSSARPKSK